MAFCLHRPNIPRTNTLQQAYLTYSGIAGSAEKDKQCQESNRLKATASRNTTVRYRPSQTAHMWRNYHSSPCHVCVCAQVHNSKMCIHCMASWTTKSITTNIQTNTLKSKHFQHPWIINEHNKCKRCLQKKKNTDPRKLLASFPNLYKRFTITRATQKYKGSVTV